jgi:hypothetical protein
MNHNQRKSNTTKYIILGVAVLILGAVFTGYKMYSEPNEFVSIGKPEFTTSADEFIKEGLESADSVFNQKYVGKSIRFTGKILSVTPIKISGDSKAKPTGSIALNSGQDEVLVNLGFHESQNADLETLKNEIGKNAEFQCECNGVSKPADEDDLLSEIIFSFSRCAVIKNKQ